MTLLEATAHLIDVAKTFGRDDAITRRATKRMEKRLAVLQLRAAKELKRRRSKAWVDFEVVYVGNYKKPDCIHCGFAITFGDFVKHAILTGRGHIKEFRCPACDAPLIGWFDEEENPGRRFPPTEVFAEDLKPSREASSLASVTTMT